MFNRRAPVGQARQTMQPSRNLFQPGVQQGFSPQMPNPNMSMRQATPNMTGQQFSQNPSDPGVAAAMMMQAMAPMRTQGWGSMLMPQQQGRQPAGKPRWLW